MQHQDLDVLLALHELKDGAAGLSLLDLGLLRVLGTEA